VIQNSRTTIFDSHSRLTTHDSRLTAHASRFTNYLPKFAVINKNVNKPDIFKLLEEAAISWSGKKTDSILPLPVSGSTRQYFRIKLKKTTIIGVWSDNLPENEAFIHFTEHFKRFGLNVPELYYKDLGKNLYLVEDLGDETLYSYILKKPSGENIKDYAGPLFRSALKHLIRFQLVGSKELSYSMCVPRPVFDEQSILWDLQYFKYYVLKLFNISFDEQKLEDDFNLMARLLASVKNDYFMYRDFQSRNILVHNDDLYFVDYQGGRKGPLQYDLASFIFESRINLPSDLREELIDFYIKELSKQKKLNPGKFRELLYLFVFLRILQVLAAYGLRGYAQNKSLFLRSYSYAVDNLEWLLDKGLIKLDTSELLRAVEKILNVVEIRDKYIESDVLTIYIQSFSFKYGIPKDYSGHGGGFVFDCRILPNPGRFPEFKEMTGMDKPVAMFLEKHNEVKDFLGYVKSILDISIDDYLQRGVNRLMVSFGCTGGQHRSVYCAEKIAAYISDKHKIKTVLVHGFYKNIGK
jgi:aminoglycoside/choline kinase family phosphotransferase